MFILCSACLPVLIDMLIVTKTDCSHFSGFKATAGGGGRGMRLAKEPGEFVKLLQAGMTIM